MQPSLAISCTSSNQSKSLDDIYINKIKIPSQSQHEKEFLKCDGGMTINVTMSTVLSKKLQKPFAYKKVVESSEIELWKHAINKKVQVLEDNQIWQIIDPPFNTKVLGDK